MNTSLYERLGKEAGISSIASDMVDLHMQNPLISTRFAASDLTKLKQTAADFFISGSGGPDVYKGRDLLETHKHMNISDNEYMAAIDDVMAALDKNGIGQKEKEEVLFIFYSLRPNVVRV